MAALCEMGRLSELAAIPALPFFRHRSPRLSWLSARPRSRAVLQTPAFSRNLTQLASCKPSCQCLLPCSARSAVPCAHRTPAWRLTRRSTRTRRYMSSTRRVPVAARRLPCFVRRQAAPPARLSDVAICNVARCGLIRCRLPSVPSLKPIASARQSFAKWLGFLYSSRFPRFRSSAIARQGCRGSALGLGHGRYCRRQRFRAISRNSRCANRTVNVQHRVPLVLPLVVHIAHQPGA
jgi:hypothetical protein